ncbi:uncharacterized protein LOC142168926 [Nicotiana tabacum]|uniref:Uncharacterized protein LOC142168926 n=1 Tax=Nicotiana tabacum TaxID=4097 RepID=A0AC58SMK1_TOBAC
MGSASSITDGFVEFTLDSAHPFYVHPSDSPGSQLVAIPFNGAGFVHWFGQSNGSKYIQIQREISFNSQGSSDIATYFTRMRALWDELNSAYVGHTCSCGALPKFIEDQHLFQFLSGLNELYSTIKSSTMLMSPLPSISKAYSLLQHDESQKENQPPALGFSGDSASFSATTTNSAHVNQMNSQHNTRPYNQRINFDPKRNSPFVSCKYCKKPGHAVDKCYRLHGFPDDFKFTKNKRFTSCVQVEELAADIGPSIKSSDSTAYGFSKEQYQHLMSLFQQTHISPGAHSSSSDENIGYANFAGLGKISWILDSGSTNHMTFNKQFLHNLQPLPKPYLIALPNGYKVKVISTGSLLLRRDIALHNGPSLKRPLKIGRASHGLYFLLPDMPEYSPFISTISFGAACNVLPSNSVSPFSSPSCISSTSVNKSDLFWHQRLGHMPFHKMKSIPFLSNIVSFKQSFSCPVCLMARQQRLPFPESHIKSTSPFQLVHLDLWGLYHTMTYNGFRYFLNIVDDFSRVTWTHLLSCKSNAFSIIKAFTNMVQIHFHSSIQTFRADNTFELGSSSEAQTFFSENEILYQTTIPHTPQQNEGECVLTATYIINRMTSSVLGNMSPFQRDVVFHEHVFPYSSPSSPVHHTPPVLFVDCTSTPFPPSFSSAPSSSSHYSPPTSVPHSSDTMLDSIIRVD